MLRLTDETISNTGNKYSLKGLAALKKHNHTVGSLRYKSDYESINLQQHYVTYRFYDMNHIGLQGFKERIRITGANQFWNIPGIEFANAKLLNLPDGYYLAVTTYCDKGGEQRKNKAVKLLRKAYQKLSSRKKDAANKIVHELLEHERVYAG